MFPRTPLLCRSIFLVCLIIVVLCLIFKSRMEVSVVRNDIDFQPTASTSASELYSNNLSEDQPPPESTTTTTTTMAFTTYPPVYINPSDFKFDINLQNTCHGNETYLLIYVHSSPENTDRRTMVRETWGSEEILSSYKAKLVFVMGRVENKSLTLAVKKESEKYRDIIQADFVDSYRNLTLKAVAALTWVTRYCPDVTYVLKSDDDVAIDIRRLLFFVKTFVYNKWGTSDVLACHVWKHMNVDRNVTSKWYTSPEEYPKDFFLKYCSGTAYLISSDVVTAFHKSIPDTPFFWVDDYYVTGLLAKAAGVEAKPLNDRFIVDNARKDMSDLVRDDNKTRIVFIHTPNVDVAYDLWDLILKRWQ